MQKGQALEPVSKRAHLLNTSLIRADYGQQRVPVRCGCYGGWVLWRSFTGTTSVITQCVHRVFHCSAPTQPGFSQYCRRRWFPQWARCTDTTATKLALNTALSPLEECNTFTRAPRGKNYSEAPHIDHGCMPLSIFMLYFAEVVTLLVVEANRYYNWCLGNLDIGLSLQPDVNEAEMFVFLAITVQMGHGLGDQLTDCWAKMDHFYTPFYSKMMGWNRYLHILWFLCFMYSRLEVYRMEKKKIWQTAENVGCIWNSKQDVFQNLQPFRKSGNREVIVLVKGRVIPRHYLPKEHRHFDFKIYKPCDSSGYTYDMRVYLGKESEQHSTWQQLMSQ